MPIKVTVEFEIPDLEAGIDDETAMSVVKDMLIGDEEYPEGKTKIKTAEKEIEVDLREML